MEAEARSAEGYRGFEPVLGYRYEMEDDRIPGRVRALHGPCRPYQMKRNA